jgi:Ca2+-binding EF-hand superfamily protein
MMCERYTPLIVLAVLALAVQPALSAPITFKDVDGNRDGKITSDEMYVFIQHKAFTQIDADGSWIITHKEWDKSEPKDHPRVIQFSDLDTNMDGRITAIEFAGSLSKRQVLDNLFRTLDRDGNGLLTEKELAARPTPKPASKREAKPAGKGDLKPVGKGDSAQAGKGEAEPAGKGDVKPAGKGDAEKEEK